MASIDVRSVPIIGDHTFFIMCEEERHRARAAAQTAADPLLRFEATLMVTHLLQWQIDDVPEMMEGLKDMSSYDPRRAKVVDWITSWTDNAGRELQEWADFQNAMVAHIGTHEAERIARERVTPRLERVKRSVRDSLVGKVREIAEEHGLDIEAGETHGVALDPPELGFHQPSPIAQPPTDESKICPDCAEEVKMAARKCRFCGYRFDSTP